MALRLYRGQTLLGSIELDWEKADFPWHGGTFTPTEHFESVRPLFDAELALRGQPPEWDEAYAQIVPPGLTAGRGSWVFFLDFPGPISPVTTS